MSAFAGEGVNLAMHDGAEPARALLAHPGDTEPALDSYENDLFPKSEKLARDLHKTLNGSSAKPLPRAWWTSSASTLHKQHTKIPLNAAHAF